jgi:excisionase family DNA binding protein
MGEQQRKRGVPVGLGRLAVSKTEAAESLGVSVDFFEEHVMHELRVVREGRRRLIPVSELVGWLDSRAHRVLDETPAAARPPRSGGRHEQAQRGDRGPARAPVPRGRGRPKVRVQPELPGLRLRRPDPAAAEADLSDAG